MKLVGYIRVSTRKQAKEGVSLEDQEEKLKQYCALYDHELVKIIVDTESAKSMKRVGIKEVLETLKTGDAEGVLITKLDRLTRSRKDFCVLLDKYFSKDFALLSITDQLDTKSASGRLVINILVDVAQWEREVISERTSAAMQHKKSKGEYTGGVIPYGFQLDEDGIILLPNEAEQKVIEKAKKLRNWEYSFGKISKILARQGHLSRKHKPFGSKSIMSMVA